MRFRTGGDSFGVKKNFLGKAPVSAFQAFTFGQGQRMVLAEKTGAKARSFNIPDDLTIHFQLNPDGSLPKIAAVGQRLIRNVTQGSLHAYQNRRDLQTLVTALFNEGMTQTQLAHKIDLAKALPEAMKRLAENNPAVAQLLGDYEITAHKVRLMATEDPRMAPNTLFEGAHVHANLPDTFVQKGAWYTLPDGEQRFVGYGNIMSAFSRDADGDFMTIYHFASKAGGKNYALGHKFPAYKRHGFFEMEEGFDLARVLKHAEKQMYQATPEGFKGAMNTHEISGLGAENLVQKLQHRAALARKIRGERGFQGLTPEEQKEFLDLTHEQLVATADTGRQHTKVVYKELFEAWGEALERGEMSVQELNDFLAGRMNVGNFRFEQLELKVLKRAKAGGAARELYATNLEEFRMTLVDAANFGVMGYKKLGKMSATDKVRMLAAIVGEGGMKGLADLNSEAFQKIEEAFMYPLAAGLRRVENPFIESLHRSGVQKRLAGQRTFFDVKGEDGIFETMMRSGLYEVKKLTLSPQEYVAPELQDHFKGLSTILQRGWEGELYSPIGGFGTTLADGSTVINTPVLRTGVVVNVAKKQAEVASGSELARRYLNQAVQDRFEFRYRNENHSVRFGRAEGVFSQSNVATDLTLAKRLAEGFVVDSPDGRPLDAIFTKAKGSMMNMKKEVRIEKMAQHIQYVAAHGTEQEYRTILAQAHSLMKGGKNIARRFQAELKDVSVLLGPDQNMVIGKSGQVRFGAPELLNSLVNQLSVLLPHDTNDPYEFGEARAILERNLSIHLADAAAKIKGGVGTVMEMGTETGELYRHSGAFGTTPRRAFKNTSQFRNSIMVRNQTLGYINIDTIGMIKEDPRFAQLSTAEIVDKYLNNGDGLTNRYKQFGEGSAFLTDDFSAALQQARKGAAIPGLALNYTPTEEEIETKGLVSKRRYNPLTGEWTEKFYQPAFNGEFRDLPKVVDEFGEWKIEPTRVKSIRTAGGEVVHGLMPIGEAYGKTEGGLAGLVFNQAQRNGMSRQAALDLVQELAKEEAEITAMKNVLMPEQMVQRLEGLREKAFLKAGLTREQLEVTLANDEKILMEGVMARGATLGAVMNSVEIQKEFEATHQIQLGSTTGEEVVDQLSTNIFDFLRKRSEETGTAMTLRDGTPITKAWISDTIKKEGIDQHLKTVGLENLHSAVNLGEMLGVDNPLLSDAATASVRHQFTGTAQRLGQQVAAAESIGGIAMKKTAEHLGSVMERLTGRAKIAPVAVITGAALLISGLQGHHEKERRRHRPFLPR